MKKINKRKIATAFGKSGEKTLFLQKTMLLVIVQFSTKAERNRLFIGL